MTRSIINFDPDSQVPKYRQIVISIKRAIERKYIRIGDRIPSINQVCTSCMLSRDTVMMAYNELKSLGIISSRQGKGYYVESTDLKLEEKVFLLFDELNSFKEDLYNALVESLDSSASVDVFFHNFNYQVFRNQIIEAAGKYTTYVIMPASFDNIGHLIQKLPSDKVFILDRMKPELTGYPGIYQDFDADTYDGLVAANSHLGKYRRLVLIHPGGKEPQERVAGFRRFCQDFHFENRIVRSLNDIRPALYDVFLVPSDRALVELVKVAWECEFTIGEKFGIISFNDSMLKEVVAGGITTISTDFPRMGQLLSSMITERQPMQLKNSSSLILRNSL